jgi:hypothetical protein
MLPRALAALACLTLASPARAASHLWRFSEFYSSADRKVQFIEMVEIFGSDDETNISEHWYQTNSYNLDHSKLLGRDLPFGTARKNFLVGSRSYELLARGSGLPLPDYVIDDGAIDPAGDTVVWWFYQTKTIPPGLMPTDGVNSIHVTDPMYPSSGYGVAKNSPTNFDGATGSVVLPRAVPATSSALRALLGLGIAALLFRALRRSQASP